MSVDIKILKSSCCTIDGSIRKELEKASERTGIDIQLETLSDLKDTMKYGVMNFPSIVINGETYNYDKIEGIHELAQLFIEHTNQ